MHDFSLQQSFFTVVLLFLRKHLAASSTAAASIVKLNELKNEYAVFFRLIVGNREFG